MKRKGLQKLSKDVSKRRAQVQGISKILTISKHNKHNVTNNNTTTTSLGWARAHPGNASLILQRTRDGPCALVQLMLCSKMNILMGCSGWWPQLSTWPIQNVSPPPFVSQIRQWQWVSGTRQCQWVIGPGSVSGSADQTMSVGQWVQLVSTSGASGSAALHTRLHVYDKQHLK